MVLLLLFKRACLDSWVFLMPEVDQNAVPVDMWSSTVDLIGYGEISGEILIEGLGIAGRHLGLAAVGR